MTLIQTVHTNYIKLRVCDLEVRSAQVGAQASIFEKSAAELKQN